MAAMFYGLGSGFLGVGLEIAWTMAGFGFFSGLIFSTAVLLGFHGRTLGELRPGRMGLIGLAAGLVPLLYMLTTVTLVGPMDLLFPLSVVGALGLVAGAGTTKVAQIAGRDVSLLEGNEYGRLGISAE